MKSAILAMSRGTVVLDENLKDLKSYLQERNIRVFEAPAGFSDSLVAIFASGRILVTNNTKDFKIAAAEHEFGIIATEGCTRNAQDLGPAVSKALIENSLWSQTKPFIFHLSTGNLEPLHG